MKPLYPSRSADIVNFLILVLIHVTSNVLATHFRGAHMWFDPVTEGELNTVDIQFRISWRRSYQKEVFCNKTTIDKNELIGPADAGNLQCYDGCSDTIGSLQFRCTDYSLVEDWTTGLNTIRHTFDYVIEKQYIIGWQGESWLSGLIQGGDTDWQMKMKLDLSTRSDLEKVNSPPRSVMGIITRIQYGCSHVIKIPYTDPDGDVVRCRWAEKNKQECGGVCSAFIGSELDGEKCELTFPSSGQKGWNAAAIQLEDFIPGNSEFSLSSVPLQFLVEVYESRVACDAKPEFIAPTLPDEGCFALEVGKEYTSEIVARSKDTYTKIVEITTVSSVGMRKSEIMPYGEDERDYAVNITWTPTNEQKGEKIFCFSAADDKGSTSAQRCIYLVIGVFAPKALSAELNQDLSSVEIKFDQQIQAASSETSITVYDSNDEKKLVMSADDSNISFKNDTMTINFPSDLRKRGGLHYINLGTGAVRGKINCGADSVGVTDNTLLTFYFPPETTTTPATTPTTTTATITTATKTTVDETTTENEYSTKDMDTTTENRFLNITGASNRKTNKPMDYTWLILVVVGAVVLVAIFVAVGVAWKRKYKTQNNPEGGANGNGQSRGFYDNTPPSFNDISSKIR